MTAASNKHRFHSAIADEANTDIVRPSNWNDDHDIYDGTRTIAGTSDTIAQADHRCLLIYSAAGATAVSLPAPTGGNMPLGWKTRLRRTGAAALTVTGTGGATINGSATLILNTNETAELFSIGTAAYTAITNVAASGGGGTPEQARSAIYAAPFDALAYNGMQINGSCDVSQERGFSNPLAANGYACDGWIYSLSSPAPGVTSCGVFPITSLAGFPNCLVNIVGTAKPALAAGDSLAIHQAIEGYRTARLAWGTANAQPVTIGFWTDHGRIGTYSVTLRNSAVNRTYVATYTQNAAETWEYKTITIPGDTAGTWLQTNGVGILISFTIACGTTYTAPSAGGWLSGNYLAAPGQVNAVTATSDFFRITGLIVLPGIEVPSASRSPLIMRPYGQELVTCKRYFQRLGETNSLLQQGYAASAFVSQSFSITLPVEMRASPTIGEIGTWTRVNSQMTWVSNPRIVGMQNTPPAIGAYHYYPQNATAWLQLDARL